MLLTCSFSTTESPQRTARGYWTFRCSAGQCSFNERTGTSFNHAQVSIAIVLLVVLGRLRYKLSVRDLAELFRERSFEFTHEAVRDWEARFAPLLTDQLRAKRQGKAGKSWYCDETYVRVGGEWPYLYRASYRDGTLVDSMLSQARAMDAAKGFFQGAREVTGGKPERVTTDGHTSYPRALRRILGRKVEQRTNQYRNNRIEPHHRGVKQRTYPMRGLGNFASAARVCRADDEQRSYFRVRTEAHEKVSLVEQRRLFRQRFAALQESLIAA